MTDAPTSDAIAARRRQLVDAACDVFAARGYAAAGVNEIAERAGVAPGTFYLHFASRRDILDHVLDHVIERLAQAIGDGGDVGAAQNMEDVAATLSPVADRVFAAFEDDPRLVRVILALVAAVDDELTVRLGGVRTMALAMATSQLERGVRTGVLRPDLDPQVAAEALAALIVSWAWALLSSDTPPDRRRYVDGLVRLACGGLGSPAGEAP